jgi:hypothetical protein
MNTHYNNNRQKAQLTSGIDKKGVLANLQKVLVPPHPVMEVLLPPVARVGFDGEHHINIDSYAATQLGKGMHPRASIRFDHPLFGPFGSIEGFWNWYATDERDDRLRTLMTFEMRQFMERNNFRKINPTDLRFRIMEATWVKIAGHPAMSKDMRESTLPFDIYRPSNEDVGNDKARSPVRIRPPFANWMIPAFEEIRLALKQNRLPDLFGLLSTVDDRENIQTLATPEVRARKPKVKKPQAERNAATDYGNLLGAVEPELVIDTQASIEGVEGSTTGVTGIANPDDTMEEGGVPVQELVEYELTQNPVTEFAISEVSVHAPVEVSNTQPGSIAMEFVGSAGDERFASPA